MKTVGLSSVFLVMFVACGGDATDGSNDPALCENFSPCGGDPVGSWSLASFCIGDADVDGFEECPGATFNIDASQSGSVELSSDSGYQRNVFSNTRGNLSVPGSCLVGITDCGSLERADESLSCSGDPAASCTCTGEESDVDMATGTWAVSGNTLALTDEDGTESLEFCVEGNTLTLRDDEGAVTRLTR